MRMLNPRSIHIISFLIVAISLCVSTLSSAGTPSSFSSVEDMIGKLGDYSASDGTFKIIEKEPLHILLKPKIVKGDNQNVINEMVQRAIVYGIYRAFIHTTVDQITVTSLPIEIDYKTKKKVDVPEYQITISKTRKDSLELIKKHIGVSSFSDLITEIKVGDTVLPEQWTSDFKRIYYNDQGSPGLTLFVDELSK